MAQIKGRVIDGGGPRAKAYVRLIGPSGEFTAEEYTGEDGAFVFHVVDGSWRLEARAAGAETTEANVQIAGDDADVTIELSRA